MNNTTLAVIVIIVILVIVVLLLATPTCKQAVARIRANKAKKSLEDAAVPAVAHTGPLSMQQKPVVQIPQTQQAPQVPQFKRNLPQRQVPQRVQPQAVKLDVNDKGQALDNTKVPGRPYPEAVKLDVNDKGQALDNTKVPGRPYPEAVKLDVNDKGQALDNTKVPGKPYPEAARAPAVQAQTQGVQRNLPQRRVNVPQRPQHKQDLLKAMESFDQQPNEQDKVVWNEVPEKKEGAADGEFALAPEQFRPKLQSRHDIKVPETVRVLNGPIEHLFDVKSTVEEEFGITEEELDAMAMEFKKRHLSEKKPMLARNRAIRRTEVEMAERNIRESMKNHAVMSKRLDTDEVMQEIMRQNVRRNMEMRKGAEAPKRTFVLPTN